MTAIWMFLAAVCVLGPLVALHEWGHYIVARLCGVKVLTYSIGFGPKLIGWKSKKSGIDYRISAIPLGGYVKMLNEAEGQVKDNERHLAFNNQHPLKKMAIVIAGPLMNFIITIALFFVLFLQPSEQLNTRIGKIVANTPAAQVLLAGEKITAVDRQSVATWEDINYALASRMGETGVIDITIQKDGQSTQKSVSIKKFMQGKQTNQDAITSFGALPYQPVIEPVLSEIVPDGAAALMGLKVGDRILSIDGVKIDNWIDATSIIRNSPEKMLYFEVLRDAKTMTIKVMPKRVSVHGQKVGQIGVKVAYDAKRTIPADYVMTVDLTPMQALTKSFVKTYDLAKMTIDSIKKMILGMIGIEHISGPITIAEISKTSFEIGWQQVLSTAAIISLSLAVMNLLPIPVLDGGHLLYYTYELIFGKPMSEKAQLLGLRLGFTLLLCFMALAIGNDIVRLFG
ncbi:RIP metalloprotease RseP [Moraxella sp. Tifton1]|uniref:RIP metalloprotease RseP n=1 Tax=Moraxella oculi TaxID=2940516 RepID=UPI002012897A|nr:RIP metalloprotease RseP [Moraxella sp. Tifton1]MCL1622774.1 RIP metalloprotease RseP [Moraxella sp. Tifton1]